MQEAEQQLRAQAQVLSSLALPCSGSTENSIIFPMKSRCTLTKLNGDLDGQGLVEQEAARRRLHEENQACCFSHPFFCIFIVYSVMQKDLGVYGVLGGALGGDFIWSGAEVIKWSHRDVLLTIPSPLHRTGPHIKIQAVMSFLMIMVMQKIMIKMKRSRHWREPQRRKEGNLWRPPLSGNFSFPPLFIGFFCCL